MGISIGKAHNLKRKAAAFTVQPSVNMNATQEKPDGPGATPPSAQRATAREAEAKKGATCGGRQLGIPTVSAPRK
jgi:hypothetical protein